MHFRLRPQVGVTVGGGAPGQGWRRLVVLGGLVLLPEPPPPLHPLPGCHSAGRLQWSSESEPVRTSLIPVLVVPLMSVHVQHC